MEIEEARKKYEETGICEWCGGTKKVTRNAGCDDEYTEDCEVCNTKSEEADMSGASEGDR